MIYYFFIFPCAFCRLADAICNAIPDSMLFGMGLQPGCLCDIAVLASTTPSSKPPLPSEVFLGLSYWIEPSGDFQELRPAHCCIFATSRQIISLHLRVCFCKGWLPPLPFWSEGRLISVEYRNAHHHPAGEPAPEAVPESVVQVGIGNEIIGRGSYGREHVGAGDLDFVVIDSDGYIKASDFRTVCPDLLHRLGFQHLRHRDLLFLIFKITHLSRGRPICLQSSIWQGKDHYLPSEASLAHFLHLYGKQV